MLKLIDCHAHLSDKLIMPNINLIREEYLLNGVSLVLDTGYSVNSSILASQNAKNFNEVYFACGIHPDRANEYNDSDLAVIENLIGDKKCLAVGETGLDYHYDGYDKQKQKELFCKQIKLADKYNLPIVIHSRDACYDTLCVMKENLKYLSHGFLMHCFSESSEIASELVKMGGYFSFGGTTTYKNSKRGEVLKTIPLDRLLIETDTPYLTPVPKRGEINSPKNIYYTYQKVAEILNLSEQRLSEIVNDNFSRLFKIKV